MCLGTIAKVIEVHRDGRAVVDVDGVRQEVLEMTLSDDDIGPGDWVVINSGFALERLTESQAQEALRIRGAVGPAHHETASSTESPETPVPQGTPSTQETQEASPEQGAPPIKEVQ
ncbi:HypC/HybG/HupF family hydrogenase formation chaperone [Demequina muriae]|uniref:HypC/HybG/HupF family hydrogenase formation chaperone n=1 Tax=Demequina muriae TaxID=3051664 RepID=A0ABT8GEJ8_9MICO|nr:HypC/HybG/HupF family hydrogenase formation chaperone [Demequina sp. EGI L300058]MDN4479689.1 HypC/HybG/HupF family hydrogenase formation chaperone [Demequina sp. EGI L300058]